MKNFAYFLLMLIVSLTTVQVTFSQCAFTNLNNFSTSSTSASYSQNSINNNNVGGAALNYPATGTHNALIVFVQSKDDIYKDCRQFTGYNPSTGQPNFSSNGVTYNDCAPNGNLNPDSWQIGGYQSWDSDPVSEWPADLPNEGSDPTHMRQLPAWARNGFIDSINSTTITPNSLTEYYNQMSNGRFLLRGQVWPHTYVMNQNAAWYHSNATNGEDAQVLMSREIISYINSNPEGINFNDPAWDRYRNGFGTNFTPDNRFDMIIIVFRYGNIRLIVGENNVVTLGGLVSNAGKNITDPSNAFFRNPLKLGNYDVIGAVEGGSGVYLQAQTKTKAFKTIAHEIGHVQFGRYHTDEAFLGNVAYDHFSIMNGTHDLSFTAQDRIKLGWANVQYVGINTISNAQTFSLEDASTVNTSTSDVIWIRNGSTNGCGDIVIESRLRSTILDRKPGQGSVEDGDGADYHLPDEGLYIYKASDGSSVCGSSVWGFSSMPNGGIGRVKRGPGVLNKRHGGYIPGDVYSPFSVATHDFHTSSLDQKVAITDIVRSGDNFTFKVWKDFLNDPNTGKYVSTFYNFGNSPANIGRNNNWAINGNMTLNGTNVSTSPNPSTVSFGNGSYLYINGVGVNFHQATFTSQNGGTWKGITMSPGSSTSFDYSSIGNVGNCWGCAALTVNSASLTFNNSEIDVPSGGAVYGLYATQYGGSNSVSINHSKIKSASESTIVTHGLPVYVSNSQIIQANGSTALYTTNTTATLGNDKIKGGKLSAGYNGAILGGLYSGYGSHNHFCDGASSSLEAFGGGYIYANNNYWNNTPTMSGSPIYYNGSMGAPSCSSVSTALARANETSTQVRSMDTSANPSISASASDDKVTDVSLLSALGKVGVGKIEEALADLQVVVNSGKMPDAQIAFTHIGQLSAQYQKGQQQRGFVNTKLKKNDPLYLTALETSALLDASEGKTADAINTLKTLANADKGATGFYAQLNMAQLYRQMGDDSKAKATLASTKPQDEHQKQDLDALLAALGEMKAPNSMNEVMNDEPETVALVNTSEAVQITAYPNPFNPSTTLSYNLPQEANVRLTVYDVTGREVSVLVNQKQPQGVHQAMWQATSFASGVYFYKLAIGEQVLSGKLMLVK